MDSHYFIKFLEGEAEYCFPGHNGIRSYILNKDKSVLIHGKPMRLFSLTDGLTS